MKNLVWGDDRKFESIFFYNNSELCNSQIYI